MNRLLIHGWDTTNPRCPILSATSSIGQDFNTSNSPCSRREPSRIAQGSVRRAGRCPGNDAQLRTPSLVGASELLPMSLDKTDPWVPHLRHPPRRNFVARVGYHARSRTVRQQQPTGSTRIGSGAPSSAADFGGTQQALPSRARSVCIAFSSLTTAIASRRIRAAPAWVGTTIL